MLAAGTHRIGFLETLLEHGADLNARDRRGATVLYAVVDSQRVPHDGNAVATMKYLLEHGADPNASDKSGMTTLMFAAGKCDGEGPELIRVLLAHGADSSIKDHDGYTALDYAKECKTNLNALTSGR